jgi:hypothetical protein
MTGGESDGYCGRVFAVIAQKTAHASAYFIGFVYQRPGR